MKLRNMITALFLTAGIAFSSTAAAVTIFFNEAEVPGLSSGMPVTNEWASFGIDLSGTYWYIDGRDPFDQRGIANSGLEGIVSFIAGTNSFTVDWLTISGSITIEAFSSADALLDSYTATCAGGAVECSGTETLSGSDIAYFKFRDGGGTVGISTLTFDSVPEPGTLALLGLGLAGLAASRRRNQ